MQISMMITADYATVDPITGKLHILGVFRDINAKAFPVQLNRMCLAMIIEGEIADSKNPHKLSVTLVDEDGVEIFTIQGPFELPKNVPGIAPHCSLIWEFNDLRFEKPGQYCFHAMVNEDEADGRAVIQVVGQDVGNG